MPPAGNKLPQDRAVFDPELERAATRWFFLRDAGFTAEDERAFAQWLRADARHTHALAEIETSWQALGTARDLVVSPPTAAAFATIRRSRRTWRMIGLATAASLTLTLSAWWWARDRAATDPGSRRTATACFVQALSATDGMRRMDLPDGSTLTLNAASAAEVRYTPAERRILLRRGEAHFAVTKNPARPFLVEANGVAVKAVGTAFNVRLRTAAVEVIVTEGRVRVDDAILGRTLLATSAVSTQPADSARDADETLAHGKKVVIALSTDSQPTPAVAAGISTREIEEALAWQKRWLDYTDAPLSTIIADFNRFNQHRLVIADPALADRRFGGTFPAGDYSSLVEMLEKTFGVAVERRANETILRLR